MPRTVRAVIPIVIVVALLLAGCGSGQRTTVQLESTAESAGTPGTSPQEAAPPTSRPDAAIATIPGDDAPDGCAGEAAAPPSGQVHNVSMSSASYVFFEGIGDLVWASTLIVRGTISAVCPATGGNSAAGSEWMLDVAAVYRGEPLTRVAIHDATASHGMGPNANHLVGRSVLLFLFEGRETLYSIGTPQGIWHEVDDLVWAGWCCGSFALTLAELEQAIAFSLAGDPPERLPVKPVSLRKAPPGPDLPEPVERPSGCGGMLVGAISSPERRYQHSEHIADLAWYSHQIVIGDVVEQLPSFRATDTSGGDPLFDYVFTDYVIQVEGRVRGLPSPLLRVRQLGGTVGDCVVRTRDAPLFAVGERIMLFATTPEPDASDPTYYPTGGHQGVWRFDTTGTMVSNWLANGLDEYPPTVPSLIPLAEMLEYFETVLTDPPPTTYALIPSIVGPGEAPLAPDFDWPRPERDPSSAWTSYSHPVDGWTLEYPAGWSLTAPGTHGSVTTLTSFPEASTPVGRPPDGELRIDIEQVYGPSTQQPHVMTVGLDQYPGILGSGTHHLRVHYYAAGNHWMLTASFKAQPSLDDPNVSLFFLIADSIVHHHPPPDS